MAREIEQEYSYNSFEHAMNMIDLITVICLYSQMTLSIILNMTVVIYILINRFFAPINILILNLAISDLMYASTIPFYVSQFMPQPVSQTQLGCRISLLIDWTSMIVNVFTIAALTIERYVCLKDNQIMIESDRKKLPLTVTFILILWAFSLGFTMPKVISISSVYHEDSKEFVCTSSLAYQAQQLYTIGIWLVAFVIPYVIILVFSALLIKFLQVWSKKFINLTNCKISNNNSESHHPSAVIAGFSKNILQNKNSINKTIRRNSTLIKMASNRATENFEQSNKLINKNESLKNEKSYSYNNLGNLRKDESKFTAQQTRKYFFGDERRNHDEKCSAQPSQQTKISRMLMIKKRSTRFVLTIAISFLLTWLPLWLMQTALIFTNYSAQWFKIMNNLTLTLVYVKGFLNPLLFMILTQNFKDKIKNLVKGVKN